MDLLMRTKCVLVLTAFLLSWRPEFLEAESLNLTTYYPAPYGGYISLLTTGGTVAPGVNTVLARDYGRVGIGTAAPRAKLSVMDTVNGLKTGLELSSYHRPGVVAGSIINAYDDGGGVRSLVLQSNGGRLGIGPNRNPQASLHVVGTFKLQDGTEAAGRTLTSDANGRASWAALTTAMPNCNNPGTPEASSNRPCLAPLYRCPTITTVGAITPSMGSGVNENCHGQLHLHWGCGVIITIASWNTNFPAAYPCTFVARTPLY